jgi:tetratricopeptide (TPR) repeat protein
LPGTVPPPPRWPEPGNPAKPRKTDPTRSGQLVTIGDRLFRAGNLHRAAERYEQAMNADPAASSPRVRLAQIALVRGNYAEAADRYREAMATEPGWLANAPDDQAIYGEPGDFNKQISKLETHLQAQPGDRDAWFVLGAQWYLSGQTGKAADVFLRLSDRKGDATLAAFLDASTPRRPGPQ